MKSNLKKADLLVELRSAETRIAELEAALGTAKGRLSVFDERQPRTGEEALFSKVFHSSPSQMALTDTETARYVEVNEAFLQTMGFTRAEVVGKTAAELNLFVDPGQRAVLLGKMSQQGYLRNENVQVRTRSGEVRHGIFAAEYVEIEQRRFLLTVMDDVTERRRVEETLQQSEARYHAMIANAKDMVVIVDGQGLFKFVSPASTHIMGYSPEELLGHDFRETIHPDDLHFVNESFVHRGQVAGRARETLKVRTLHKDGDWRVLEALGTSMFNDPTVRGLVMNVCDVTEQEVATTALRESEIRYRGLFEDSPLALLEQDFSAVKARLTALRQNGVSDFKAYFKERPDEVAECATLIKVLDANKAAVELFRAQKKEDLLKDLTGYLDGDAIRGFEDELVFLAADQAEFEWEGVNKTVDGKLIDIQLKFCAAPDHHHDLSRVIVSIHDITAWKKANLELKETRDQLLEAQRLAHLGHWEWNLDEQKLTWSDEVYRIFNVSPIDFVVSVEAFESFIHPDDKEDFLRQRTQMLEEKQFASIDHRIVLADGQVRHVQERTQLILGEDGKVVRVMGTVQDITERKEAEENLRKNEALLSEAQRLGHVGHWEWVDGQLTGSDEFFRIFGLPVGDHHISLQNFGKALNPGMVEPMRILDRAISEKRTDMNYEFSIPTLEGGKRWLHQYAKITYAETGKPQYMLGIIRDITDFKTAEEIALKRSALLQDVQHMANIQSWVLNTQTGIMTIGPDDDQIMEWQAGDYTQQDLLPMIHPEDLSWVLSAWSETTKTNKNLDLEYRILVNGKLKWIHVKTAYGIEENSSPYVIGFSQDITEHKQAEGLNAAQRSLTRLVSEDAPISVTWKAALQTTIHIAGLDCGGIYHFNSDLRELELIEYTGLSETFINAVRRIPENSLGMQELLAGKALYLSEAELTPRELYREEGLRSLAIIPIQHQGELIGCINIASHKIDQIPDVSRLSLETLSFDIGNILVYRRADEALRLSEEKYRLLAENISDVIWILDLEELRFRYISPSVLQLCGYSVEEVLAQPMADSLTSKSAAYLAEVLPGRIEEFERGILKTYMDEIEQPCKDGSTVWTETTTRFMLHSTTGKLEVYGVSRNITQRKRMERQLRETLNKLEGAEEQAGFGSWYFEVATGTGWWSKQMCRLFEWDSETDAPRIDEYLAMIHPEDRKQLEVAMNNMVHGALPEIDNYRIVTRSGIERVLNPFYHVVKD